MNQPRQPGLAKQKKTPPDLPNQSTSPANVQNFNVTQQHYSGPIPPPSMMAQYNDVMPNGADRIMRMAEKQQDHRHKLEETVIMSDAAQSRNGLISGTMCMMTAYIVSGILGVTGHEAAAGVVAGTVTVVFGGTYALGTWMRRGERANSEAKRQELRDKRL